MCSVPKTNHEEHISYSISTVHPWLRLSQSKVIHLHRWAALSSPTSVRFNVCMPVPIWRLTYGMSIENCTAFPFSPWLHSLSPTLSYSSACQGPQWSVRTGTSQKVTAKRTRDCLCIFANPKYMKSCALIKKVPQLQNQTSVGLQAPLPNASDHRENWDLSAGLA